MSEDRQAFPEIHEVLRAAERFKQEGNFRRCLDIYLLLSDGDPSLEAGTYAVEIAECYESLGDILAAYYWYGRAVEENPHVHLGASQKRLVLGIPSFWALIQKNGE